MNNLAKRSATRLWLQALDAISVVQRDESLTFGAVLNDLAELHGDCIALIDEETSLSYRECAALANRVSAWAAAQDFPAGTVLGLFMRNCASYVAIWAGLSQAGLTVALINTNLTGDALVHCIRTGQCRGIIVEDALLDEFLAVKAALPGTACWTQGGRESACLDLALEGYSDARPLHTNSQHPAL